MLSLRMEFRLVSMNSYLKIFFKIETSALVHYLNHGSRELYKSVNHGKKIKIGEPKLCEPELCEIKNIGSR